MASGSTSSLAIDATQQGASNKPAARNPRRAVEFGAFAMRVDGSETLITVSNLSYDGCQLRCPAGFEAGEKLKLILPRLGEICAEIRWSAEGSAGARFIEKVEPTL